MCIAIATTNHPDYPFILLSNRDEFFKRPTMPAHFRDVGNGVKLLSPLDLARQEHGTWIGVTTNGKIAVLVNYRENDEKEAISEVSRGILPLDYLCGKELDNEWKDNLASTFRDGRTTIDLKKIGGFSLLYGKLTINPETGKIHHLNILSNRGDQGKVFKSKANSKDIANGSIDVSDDIPHKTTFGLSNSLYNKPWDKVKLGELLLSNLIDESITNNYSQDELIEKCFQLLSHDTYNSKILNSNDFEKKFSELKYSIFIPPLIRNNYETDSIAVGKYYGTRTQTIILLDKYGNLNYYEKNIHNSDDIDEKIVDITSHYKFNIFNDQKNGC